MKLVDEAKEVVQSRELFANFVRRELRTRYKGTALGWTWSLVNPLAQTVTFTLVFSVFLRVQPPIGEDGLKVFALFLLCGLLPWNFFASVVQGGQAVLVDQAGLIKKTYFPRRLLLLAHLVSCLITFVIEMSVLIVIFGFFGVNAWRWIPLILVFMLFLALFGLGFALALSVANVYFRDVPHFVGIVFQIWMYATPIIYPITLVTEASPDQWVSSDWVQAIYLANPMISFIEPLRDMMYMGTLPDWTAFVTAFAWGAVILLLGNMVFRRLEPRIAEEL